MNTFSTLSHDEKSSTNPSVSHTSAADFLKPLALVDLDDTLFQTHHRISPDESYQIATIDKNGQPLSYMNPTQWQFVQWLFQSTDVVAITARSVEALSRVQLQFSNGAVCSHGGTILNPDGSVDLDWHAHMQSQLTPYQAQLNALIEQLQHTAQSFGSIRTWVVEEENLGLYVVAKQNGLLTHKPADQLFLKQLLNALPSSALDGFYVHMNGNNLAIIPNVVSKANATEALLKKTLAATPTMAHRPLLGFGDSLSDAPFLSQCHWWGMPKHSQLNRWVSRSLQTQYVQEGYYGDYQ
jgi:hydroxymethylpyrimidine pyrophosphatase-like HAD family hydrolase